MDAGVIPGQAKVPFSSPKVMDTKKDGTCRMCNNTTYNTISIQAQGPSFPYYPVIEELIDELNGFVVFSKLDLRSGYHQIRMKEDDICTDRSFRTSENATIMVAALDKWKGYLLDRHFKVKTDHFSLKYLLNQKLTTPFQFKWLPKLLGYDYEIVYKKGSENVVADALSRIESSRELLQIYVSSVSSGVWDKGNKYSWTGEILKRKGKVVVGNDPELRKELVQHFHDEAIGGHSGAHVTMKKLGPLFYWKGLKKMVKQMVRDCDVCQRQKPDLSAYPGLIQPLPIPKRIWKEISMDFVEKLPTSHGKSVILVVVDRLSKYAHFIPLAHPFTASQVAQVFLDQVYKLHGLPESIVSDRDKVFLSNFWKALFAELKVKLKLSTAYHPQTDGQTEVVNRSLGCYLRCMCGEKPKEWVKWLPLAEFWYNTNYHTSTETTPYEAVYCQTPPVKPKNLNKCKITKIPLMQENSIKA
ncbi:retrotransposable element Tf2 [Tanacetum coccineum]